VSVSAGGHPLALFPMRRDVTRISSLTTPYTCLWRPLTAPGLTAAQLHGAGRAFGRWCRSWATVRLDALDLEDPAWSILLAGLRDAGIKPLPFDHFGNWSAFTGLGWDAYLADRPGQIRESLRRRGKQLLADGATFRVVTGGRDLEPAIAQYEAVYAASWKQPEPFPQFNAALMRAFQSLAHLEHHTDAFAEGNLSFGLDEFFNISALHQLHYQIREFVFESQIVNGHQIGVENAGCEHEIPLKINEMLLFGWGGRHLDRDCTPLRIDGAIDATVRTAPYALTYGELADLLKHRVTKLQPAVSYFARLWSCAYPSM